MGHSFQSRRAAPSAPSAFRFLFLIKAPAGESSELRLQQQVWNFFDIGALTDLQRRYPRGPGFAKINRFADVPYCIRINIERAQDLWLDRSPPLRVLDLGCGAGYFLYVSKYFGHQVLGLDLDDHQLF